MPNTELAEYYAQMGIDHPGMVDTGMQDGIDIGQQPFASHQQLIEAMMQEEAHIDSENLNGVKIANQLNKL